MKTIKNETNEQKGGILGMLIGILGVSLLRNMLTEKGILRAGYRSKSSNSSSFFNKYWNPKVLWEWILILWTLFSTKCA